MTTRFTRTDLVGLTAYGPSAQTIALSRVLDASPEARAELRSLLDAIEAPWTHSGCEGDRRGQVSAGLADLMRRYAGPKI